MSTSKSGQEHKPASDTVMSRSPGSQLTMRKVTLSALPATPNIGASERMSSTSESRSSLPIIGVRAPMDSPARRATTPGSIKVAHEIIARMVVGPDLRPESVGFRSSLRIRTSTCKRRGLAAAGPIDSVFGVKIRHDVCIGGGNGHAIRENVTRFPTAPLIDTEPAVSHFFQKLLDRSLTNLSLRRTSTVES